ncbi:MAG TPA: hypothetical protein VM911_19415 [Pyrinomonadaceae bacterium]|nr:hypothetical protein [Pyrinomonadaceae bacterium]
MAKYTSPLDHVRVAAPCSADWDAMVGTERARFCGQCRLNVYNLSGMTRREAEQLIAGSEGRLCVRFYRRADGTILTENCPVGLRALKRRLSRTASAAVSTILSFLAGLGLYTALDEREPVRAMGVVATKPVIADPPAVMGTFAVDPPIPLNVPYQGEWIAGEMETPQVELGRIPPLPEDRASARRTAERRRR